MLAFENSTQKLSQQEKLALLKEELGLNKTMTAGGGDIQVTDLNFSAEQVPNDPSHYIVKVLMTHTPLTGDKAEYSVTFERPFAASSADAATGAAVDSFYEMIRAYAQHRVVTPENEEAPLHLLSLGHASHIFNGLYTGGQRGNELNPASEPHRILNAPGFGRETLKNVTWRSRAQNQGQSLVGLSLAEPRWEKVSAKNATLAGSVIVGLGVFEKCDFSGTRWSGTRFCPTTQLSPFSDSYDATKCKDDSLWTTFKSCNLDGASFAYRGKDGMQGAVKFDTGCSLKNASLMYLREKTTVKIEILDQLIEAIKCKTVKPGDPREALTPALQKEREDYISALLSTAQKQLKGVMWDKTLITAAGERGPSYQLLLMRISRVANPSDVIDRIKKAEIAPSQLIELLRGTPGVSTDRRFQDTHDTDRPETVIEIAGHDMDGKPWEAEVRVATGGNYQGVIRVTARGGGDLTAKPRTPKAIIEKLEQCGASPQDPDLFDRYEEALEDLLGQFKARRDNSESKTSARFQLDLGAGVWITLAVDRTKTDQAQRFIFNDMVGAEITDLEKALLSTILDPLATNAGSPDRKASALDLLKRLGHTRGATVSVVPSEWEHEVA